MVKEKTLTIELSHENPLGDGYFYAMLDLPAEEHEIRDAIQRARMIGREESFRSIGILDCGAWPELLYYRLDSPTIDELNFFANRIAQMDDSELAIFRTVAPKVLGSPADDLLSMKDLINCTYGYDEIMVASNIRTDEQLGQFIIENELHDDVNNIPEPPHCSRRASNSVGYGTSSSSHTRRGTTARSSVATVKITNIFMPLTLFILLTTLKSSLLFTAENTITFLCVLLTGCLLPITLMLLLSVEKFSDFVTHH